MNYSYFLWNDINNAIEILHHEESENKCHVEADFWTQNNTSEFKWNITKETTGFNSIRINLKPDYSLCVDDDGNLSIKEVDIDNPYQQWVITE